MLGSWFYDICLHRNFEIFIITCISLNSVVLCFETNDQSKLMTEILDMANYFFVCIYSLECLMKIVALNWRYFDKIWNLFDMMIVFMSLLGI